MTALRKPEPAKVIPLRQESPMADAYRRSVSMHYPNTDDLSMAIRVEIMGLRDRASAAMSKACPEAQPVLAEAARIAALAALANIDTRQLGFTKSAIDSMIWAAQMLQRGCA